MARTHRHDVQARRRARDTLEVPDRSLEGVGMLACATFDNAERWAQAIAAPIVAARLRKWAAQCYADGFDVMGNRLSRDADELDGGTS